MRGFALLPAIVFDHVGKFNNKFSFFVFLTALKGMFLEGKVERRFQDTLCFIFSLYYTLGKWEFGVSSMLRHSLNCALT